jgi:hypothetical protein
MAELLPFDDAEDSSRAAGLWSVCGSALEVLSLLEIWVDNNLPKRGLADHLRSVESNIMRASKALFFAVARSEEGRLGPRVPV